MTPIDGRPCFASCRAGSSNVGSLKRQASVRGVGFWSVQGGRSLGFVCLLRDLSRFGLVIAVLALTVAQARAVGCVPAAPHSHDHRAMAAGEEHAVHEHGGPAKEQPTPPLMKRTRPESGSRFCSGTLPLLGPQRLVLMAIVTAAGSALPISGRMVAVKSRLKGRSALMRAGCGLNTRRRHRVYRERGLINRRFNVDLGALPASDPAWAIALSLRAATPTG
jgi:hypothetical protein